MTIDKKDDALKLALEALESCMGLPHWPALVPTITAIREALASEANEQPVPKTPLTVIVDELQESKNAIAACEALTPEQRHKINKPILEAQIFFRAAARMLSEKDALAEQPAQQQEPVAWRNAALRVGEDLCSVGPFGYYDMTAEQWLDWALSVVTVHAPPASKPLTDEEIRQFWRKATVKPKYTSELIKDFARAIEAAQGIKGDA